MSNFKTHQICIIFLIPCSDCVHAAESQPHQGKTNHIQESYYTIISLTSHNYIYLPELLFKYSAHNCFIRILHILSKHVSIIISFLVVLHVHVPYLFTIYIRYFRLLILLTTFINKLRIGATIIMFARTICKNIRTFGQSPLQLDL